jgi:hypothetical protein
MIKFKTNNLNNLIFVLFITSMMLFSCKREKEAIGPDLAMASSNFALAGDSFKFNSATSNFASSGNNWFNASFNERVTWQIKIRGTQSKAYKILKGTSNVLNQSTSFWTGTQSGIYFFIAGEKAIAELSVYGSNQKWYDTTTIVSVKGKTDYGPDALVWYDMENMKVGSFGYWYSYFNTPYYSGVPGVVQWGDIPLSDLKDPVQGPYRSMLAQSSTPNSLWVGGFGASDFSKASNYGFPGASLDEVYLNFYIRRKTSTTPSMSISVNSYAGKVFDHTVWNPFTLQYDSVFIDVNAGLNYTVNFPVVSSSAGGSPQSPPDGWVVSSGGDGTGGGSSTPETSLGSDSQLVVAMLPSVTVTDEVAEGWSLVSIRLDKMTPSWDSKYKVSQRLPFDPAHLISIAGGLGTSATTGFDMDFVVFTRGLPFDKLMDKNP